jgi:hypothetical protein
MPEHPSLRIQSPRPDILAVADERKKMRFLERTFIRASAFMLVGALFFIFATIITVNMMFVFITLFCIILAYTLQELSVRLRDMHEQTPTRDETIV